MLIVSKFHDYYDTAIGMGIDIECVFNRIRLEENMPNRMEPIHFEELKHSGNDYIIEPFVIGFAGEFYPGVKVTRAWMHGFNTCKHEEHIYNIVEWKEYLTKENISLPRKRWSYYKNIRSFSQAEEFFDTRTWSNQSFLFRKFNTPIFILISHKGRYDTDIIVNPTLSGYKFGKVKDAYTAFQDIHMYISGVLGVGERKMIQLSDEDKRDKKGFDKFSFKKRK